MAMSDYVGKDQQTSSTPPLGDTPSSHLPAFLEYGYSFFICIYGTETANQTPC